MSSALVWELVKNNNAFLVKRERTSRLGAVAFSSEAGNLLNVNTAKYSGLSNEGTIDIAADLTLTKKVSIYIICLVWICPGTLALRCLTACPPLPCAFAHVPGILSRFLDHFPHP